MATVRLSPQARMAEVAGPRIARRYDVHGRRNITPELIARGRET